ncbi:TadE/TadG family type IV pilus assembly protein [Sphingomonas sp. 1P08PE]|uniref:TadE/TadG family type IV pilus assembly protein n=1 Tax=Sphingomonas sp. 1P08PE TaxID=554122 RepID=UPI00399EF7DE
MRRMMSPFRTLARDRRGNVLMIFAFSILPITFATGMGIDYTTAMRLRTRLNAAADAAALSATSLSTITLDADAARQRALLVFRTQVDGMTGLLPINYLDTGQMDIRVVDTMTPSEGLVRTASVTYHAQSSNSFSGILGRATLAISGTAAAKASTAPNVDFYVMMDMSPSMALPTTTAGFNQLKTATGCAFACHSIDDRKAQLKNGAWGSLYDYAVSYGIPLRVDAERVAVQNLTYTATNAAANNHATYRISVSTFHVRNQFKTIATLNDSFATVRSRAAGAQLLQVYSNNQLTKGNWNWDVDTDYKDMFGRAMTIMPTLAGSGMSTPGNSPQAVMMIITDGMRDEDDGGRQLGALPVALCDAVKQRGIRIAVLYTEYLPDSMTGDNRSRAEVDWARANVVPKLPGVAPALQACASPNLFAQVTTDGDISAALETLFQRAITSSRLTQ